MIAYLKGVIQLKSKNFYILDVHGVGYKVFVSPITFSDGPKEGDTAELYVHTHVREDAFELYGFLTVKELELFQMVISVSGIGPKSGLGVLSVGTAEEIQEALASGDTTFFTRVPGVGRKTAERLIVELKSKVAVLAGREKHVGDRTSSHTDAVEGLIQLGYRRNEAEEALRSVPRDMKDVGDKIRAALKQLGSQK